MTTAMRITATKKVPMDSLRKTARRGHLYLDHRHLDPYTRPLRQDPDFPDPRAEADWIARALRAQVVMVPQAGHYPQSQRPGLTAGAVLRFLESVKGRA